MKAFQGAWGEIRFWLYVKTAFPPMGSFVGKSRRYPTQLYRGELIVWCEVQKKKK